MTRYAMRGWILFLSGAAVALSGAAIALVCAWLAWHGAARLSDSQKHTFSSFDPLKGSAATVQFDTGMLNLTNADLEQVLNLYQEVSSRTVIRGSHLQPVKISLRNQTPITRAETLQLLDTALAQNGITMVLMGDASVKALPTGEASSEIPPTIEAKPEELPDSSSYMTCTVQVKYADPKSVSDLLSVVSRMPKSIICVPSTSGVPASKGCLLILRDYSANIRQMLRLIQQVDHPALPRPDSFGASLKALTEKERQTNNK
jgi:type II secretory pathway component GspD/PulD (secretin)